MSDQRRILIINQSRYESLRIRREFSRRTPSDLVTVINRSHDASLELSRARYQVVIVDDYSLEAYQVNGRRLLDDVRQSSPGAVVVMIDGSNNLDERREFIYEAESGSIPLAAAVVDRDDHLPLVLPSLVKRLFDRSTATKVTNRISPSDATVVPVSLSDRLAHEVNNPLMAILGTVELLLDRPQSRSRDLDRKLNAIQTSARRIESSLNRLRNEIESIDESHSDRSRLSETGIFG